MDNSSHYYLQQICSDIQPDAPNNVLDYYYCQELQDIHVSSVQNKESDLLGVLKISLRVFYRIYLVFWIFCRVCRLGRWWLEEEGGRRLICRWLGQEEYGVRLSFIILIFLDWHHHQYCSDDYLHYRLLHYRHLHYRHLHHRHLHYYHHYYLDCHRHHHYCHQD